MKGSTGGTNVVGGYTIMVWRAVLAGCLIDCFGASAVPVVINKALVLNMAPFVFGRHWDSMSNPGPGCFKYHCKSTIRTSDSIRF